MGSCASKPKVFKSEKAPPPVEPQSPAAAHVEPEKVEPEVEPEVKAEAEKVEAEVVSQDKTDEVETKNEEEPQVDLSEPAAVDDETKDEAAPVEIKPTQTIDKAVEEGTEEKKELA